MKQRYTNWLKPGLGIKRWIFVATLGLLFILSGGLLWYANSQWKFIDLLAQRISPFTAALLFFCGLGILYWSWFRWSSYLFKSLEYSEKSMVQILYEKNQRDKGLKILALGGGTGLSSLLRGLKKHSSHLTAVVTMSDDGGSSGRLMKEYGLLPPGDIRNCLVALAEDENFLRKLFNYRFQGDQELGGHPFGNIFLTAVTEVAGDFNQAVAIASQVLKVRGRVLPVTLEPVSLCATYKDDTMRCGESNIPRLDQHIHHVFLSPQTVIANPEVIEAIEQAECIVLGPGSIFTSIIPNLLVDGVVQALEKTSAPIIYVCNIMTQPGESDTLSASGHLKAIENSIGTLPIDYVLINNHPPTPQLLKRYLQEGSSLVESDLEELERYDIQVIEEDILWQGNAIRHHSSKLAQHIAQIAIKHKHSKAEKNNKHNILSRA